MKPPFIYYHHIFTVVRQSGPKHLPAPESSSSVVPVCQQTNKQTNKHLPSISEERLLPTVGLSDRQLGRQTAQSSQDCLSYPRTKCTFSLDMYDKLVVFLRKNVVVFAPWALDPSLLTLRVLSTNDSCVPSCIKIGNFVKIQNYKKRKKATFKTMLKLAFSYPTLHNLFSSIGELNHCLNCPIK